MSPILPFSSGHLLICNYFSYLANVCGSYITISFLVHSFKICHLLDQGGQNISMVDFIILFSFL